MQPHARLSRSQFVYVNQAFQPSGDEIISNLEQVRTRTETESAVPRADVLCSCLRSFLRPFGMRWTVLHNQREAHAALQPDSSVGLICGGRCTGKPGVGIARIFCCRSLKALKKREREDERHLYTPPGPSLGESPRTAGHSSIGGGAVGSVTAAGAPMR